jgi:hypothetical protein
VGEQDAKERQGVVLPIEWYVPDNIQSRYATNMTIQAGQYEFIISFFEAELPILLGSVEDNKEQIEQMGKIRATCVGRVIIAPDRLSDFVTIMQTTLDNYRASKPEE